MPTTHTTQRFLLISIIPQEMTQEQSQRNLAELTALVQAYEGKVAEIVTQRRETHDKGKYIGRGKIEKVGELIVEKQIDVIVLNAIIRPTQIYDFQTIFEKQKPDIKVWDRVDLILHIFSKHANTTEAQLQIELASLKHMGPRIFGMGMEMSRQSGMLGTRGIGETNTEIEKRHLREHMRKISEKLRKLNDSRQLLIARRKKTGIKTISLVGYTNAGKTSLFNLLTKKEKPVKNALFVTLDSIVGKMYLQAIAKEVLVSDTIGFIRELPPQLIEAFRSTLMESIQSDVLLQVIDASDPEMEMKIAVVESVLDDLRLHDKSRIYVFNKIDQAPKLDLAFLRQRYAAFQPQFISVATQTGIPQLLECLGAELRVN